MKFVFYQCVGRREWVNSHRMGFGMPFQLGKRSELGLGFGAGFARLGFL